MDGDQGADEVVDRCSAQVLSHGELTEDDAQQLGDVLAAGRLQPGCERCDIGIALRGRVEDRERSCDSFVDGRGDGHRGSEAVLEGGKVRERPCLSPVDERHRIVITDDGYVDPGREQREVLVPNTR